MCIFILNKISKQIKIKTEKRVMKLSLIGSILFMLVEGIMAYMTGSHSILMDFIFDVTDLIMIGPFLLLVPLLYKPVTEKRPYGFAQIESLFLIVKYTVLLFVTLKLAIDSIRAILTGGNDVDAGIISVFEFLVFLGCLIIYELLLHFSKKYESDTVKAELYVWRLDVLSSIGVSIAFFAQVVFQRTSLYFIAPYIDPVVAIIMSAFLIKEPVSMIIKSLKELVLFAPDKEVMEEIRTIAEKHIKNGDYKLNFLDVVQTGRKTWVELYISSENDIISVADLSDISFKIKGELSFKFDQIYVEIIPDITTLSA